MMQVLPTYQFPVQAHEAHLRIQIVAERLKARIGEDGRDALVEHRQRPIGRLLVFLQGLGIKSHAKAILHPSETDAR
jgi:hypothetical protein